MLSPTTLDDLNRFARVVWGNPQALLCRLQPQGVEYIDLGDYFPAFERLFAGILQHDKILVRDEYRAALQALKTDKDYKRGAYVIGQPGIGKTYFLVYALIKFLQHKQPVALQLPNGLPVYLLFKDTAGQYPFVDTIPLDACPFVWALCDSNAKIETPGSILITAPSHIRIIQATSPKVSRWKEWSKQMGAKRYIMDIWSDEEVEYLAELSGLDVERMVALAKKWGNIPRTLLQYVHEQDREVEEQYAALARTAVKKCAAMMDGAAELDLPGEALSSFYFIRPQKTDEGDLDRTSSYVYVPTRTLRRFLAEALTWQSNDVKLQFYRALSQTAETRQAAGVIYESWFHSFVCTGKPINCQWLGLDNNGARLRTTLPVMTTLVPATLAAPQSHTPPYYWILPHKRFPGIDSALVLEDEIFVFQVTTSPKHKSPIKGMHELRNRLAPTQQDLAWRAVFVGGGEQIVHAANDYASELYFPTNQTRVPVGWSTVDPEARGITYREFRDESDLMLDESDEETTEMEIE